jgi:hypothetical protein
MPSLYRIFYIMLLVLMVFSCATRPPLEPANDELIVEWLGIDALKRDYGSSFQANPFLPYKGVLFGQQEEFYVARISLLSGHAAITVIEATFVSASPYEINLMPKEALVEYWEGFSEQSLSAQKNRIIERRLELAADLPMPRSLTKTITPDTEALLVFKATPPRLKQYSLYLKLLVNGNEREYTADYPLP